MRIRIFHFSFRWLRHVRKNRELENEIMKDVPGWVTGTWYGEPVYFTLGEKWWDPTELVSLFDVFLDSQFCVFRNSLSTPRIMLLKLNICGVIIQSTRDRSSTTIGCPLGLRNTSGDVKCRVNPLGVCLSLSLFQSVE